jgi:hypothetical protein
LLWFFDVFFKITATYNTHAKMLFCIFLKRNIFYNCVLIHKPFIFSTPGSLSLRNLPGTFEGLRAQIITWLTVFVMTLFAMLCSVPSKMARRISNQSINDDDYRVEYPQVQEYKEEFRPPSPAPSYTEKDVLSSMLRRLGELEDKVQVLETKPSEMPFEKEELLNAAVRRVDALEAELISTKKVRLFCSNQKFVQSLISVGTNY